MEEKVYPLMFHHEYKGEALIGSCFAFINKSTLLTAAHCIEGIDDYSRIHVGIPKEVQKQPPLPDNRKVRKALEISRHSEFDIAVIKVESEWCDAPLSEPFFHNIYDIGPCKGQTITFRGYTDDRLGDNGEVVARTKKGSITQDYRDKNVNPQPIIELEAHVERKNSGGPVIHDDMNTGTPIGLIIRFKGTSNSDREDVIGEALLLQDFKADLKRAAEQNLSSLGSDWEILF